jgi:hypothetical protein
MQIQISDSKHPNCQSDERGEWDVQTLFILNVILQIIIYAIMSWSKVTVSKFNDSTM